MSLSRRRDDDPYDAWGQDTRVPLEERRHDEEMTPGMDEQPRWQLRETPFGVVELWVPRDEPEAA